MNLRQAMIDMRLKIMAAELRSKQGEWGRTCSEVFFDQTVTVAYHPWNDRVRYSLDGRDTARSKIVERITEPLGEPG